MTKAVLIISFLFSNCALAGNSDECLRDLKGYTHLYQLKLDKLTDECTVWINKEGKKGKIGAMRNCDAGIFGGDDKPILEAIKAIKSKRLNTCKTFCEGVALGEPKLCNGELGLQTWIDLVKAL